MTYIEFLGVVPKIAYDETILYESNVIILKNQTALCFDGLETIGQEALEPSNSMSVHPVLY